MNWLRGIASNVVRNQLRKWQRGERRQRPLPDDLALDGSAAEERERSERIAQALATMSERYESVLRAKYLEQLSVAEIASAWHESNKAIESLLARARTAFREAYSLQEPDHATG